MADPKVEAAEQKQEADKEKPKPKYNILNTTVKKPAYNPEDYSFKQEEGQFKVKAVNSLNGQQFNIDGCKNGFYFIFDVTANIYIDDTENCFVFAAPVESSVFVRNCRNMVVVATAGQFRSYNCHNSHFSLYCKSQPVIESSSQLHFCSLECPAYPQLKGQFAQAKLEPINNHWSEIYNFTKKEGETHSLLSRHPLHQLQVDWKRAFQEANLTLSQNEQDVVPFIQGLLPLETQGQRVLLVFGSEEPEQD
jgi:protein XRP2